VTRALFVMEQHIGHRTYYLNLRQVVDRRAGVEGRWVEVTYTQPGGFLARAPGLPPRWRGALVGRRQVQEGLRAPFDVAFFNTQAPAALTFDALRGLAYVLSTDITPRLYDQMAGLYGHPVDHFPPLCWFKHRVNRRVFRGARCVLAWSSWARRSVIEDYGVPPERVEVLPPGVDLARWAPTEAGSDPFPGAERPGPARILFVGGDWVRKGGPELLQAFRRLAPGSAELHLVTRGRVQPEPGVHVYRGLTPNCADLRRLYRQADLFCLPTHVEAFGIAAVEASAAGLPVIAASVGGLTDTVIHGQTGLLVPPGDVDALHGAIERALDRPDMRRRMGQAARRRAEERFDARANAERLCARLQEALL